MATNRFPMVRFRFPEHPSRCHLATNPQGYCRAPWFLECRWKARCRPVSTDHLQGRDQWQEWNRSDCPKSRGRCRILVGRERWFLPARSMFPKKGCRFLVRRRHRSGQAGPNRERRGYRKDCRFQGLNPARSGRLDCPIHWGTSSRMDWGCPKVKSGPTARIHCLSDSHR